MENFQDRCVRYPVCPERLNSIPVNIRILSFVYRWAGPRKLLNSFFKRKIVYVFMWSYGKKYVTIEFLSIYNFLIGIFDIVMFNNNF